MKIGRVENITLRVERHLRSLDDFATIPMIAAALGVARNQVSASLHNLRRVRCADVVIEPDGRGWWFALPPELDAHVRPSPEEIVSGIKRQRNWRRERKA